MKKIKLSQWAKDNGVTYQTAHNWIKNGKFPTPEKLVKTPTGSIFVIID